MDRNEYSKFQRQTRSYPASEVSDASTREELLPLLTAEKPPVGVHCYSSQQSCSSPTSISPRASPVPRSEYMRPRAGSFSRDSMDIKNGLPMRKPYHYAATDRNKGDSSPLEIANYNRFRYYNKLRTFVPYEDTALLIPDHVIPNSFFYPFLATKDTDRSKNSSIITIFAIWNTMMGTSLLSMPWAVQQTGIVLSFCIMLGMGILCFYTAYRTVTVFEYHDDGETVMTEFGDLSRKLLGKWAELMSVIFSILCLMGACAVYWVLMTNFLYNIVDYIYNEVSQYPPETPLNSTQWLDVTCGSTAASNISFSNVTIPTYEAQGSDDLYHKLWNLELTVPLYLGLIFFPLVNMKSATFFTRFNSLGTLSVLYLICFVCTKAAKHGIHIDTVNVESISFAHLARWQNAATLMGMLSLALFIHNCIITIMKNNKNKKKNTRDLSISFSLVVLTYLFIGMMFFVTFPLPKQCIQDNFLNNFLSTDIMAVIARGGLFFQMMTVFPLLTYVLRVQFFNAVSKTTYPGWLPVLSLNSFLITVYCIFAILLPRIGTITRFSGALCGLVYIFMLPCFLYMRSLQLRGRLTAWSVVIHGSIFLLGVANLISQFTVTS